MCVCVFGMIHVMVERMTAPVLCKEMEEYLRIFKEVRRSRGGSREEEGVGECMNECGVVL